MEESMQTGTNREYKDRLFKWIFREKEDLLELYNALNDTAYEEAVDECIQEGILAELLRSEREEVRSMLLTEYDEQAHIESERKIAAEEAYAQGVETGIIEGEELLRTLTEFLLKDFRIDDLQRAVKDKAYRDKLYEEYGMKRLN